MSIQEQQIKRLGGARLLFSVTRKSLWDTFMEKSSHWLYFAWQNKNKSNTTKGFFWRDDCNKVLFTEGSL